MRTEVIRNLHNLQNSGKVREGSWERTGRGFSEEVISNLGLEG